MKHVLVLNAGSSSLKWVVLDADTAAVVEQDTATWEGVELGRHQTEMDAALARAPAVDAVGHRVVHGGLRFREAVLVDDDVRAAIAKLAELAPLHNPAALAGIDAALARFPEVPQVAAFDTAFHATLPESAATYPLPWEWSVGWGLRRFGFHGLSVEYAVQRATEVLGFVARRMVVCHLGAGCSITAVADGQSVDTSMGLTPLEGLMMARRAGTVDPGLMLHVLTRRGVRPSELDQALNEQSGLLGVSGVSADLRAVLAAADAGNDRARLACNIFVHRIVATIGSMVATLGGLDALVFTGGIGEHSALIRERACEPFAYVSLHLDPQSNLTVKEDRDIASPGSSVRVLVLTSREDISILRSIKRLLKWETETR